MSKTVNLNSDGQTVIVRPLSDGTSNLVVEYSQLIQENNTTYIPLELFSVFNDFIHQYSRRNRRIQRVYFSIHRQRYNHIAVFPDKS